MIAAPMTCVLVFRTGFVIAVQNIEPAGTGGGIVRVSEATSGSLVQTNNSTEVHRSKHGIFSPNSLA